MRLLLVGLALGASALSAAAAQEKPRLGGLDAALEGRAAPAVQKTDDAAEPAERRGRGWRDEWDDDDDWAGDYGRGYGRGRGRDDRGRGLRLTCGSEDYRYEVCGVRGRIRSAQLVRQRSWAPCREGRDWGVDRRGRGLWVDNGCEGEFRVSLGRGGGRGGGRGTLAGGGDAGVLPYRVVQSCLREAERAYRQDVSLTRVLDAYEGRRGWTVDLRLAMEDERWRDRRWRDHPGRDRRVDVTCRTGRRGVQIAAR